MKLLIKWSFIHAIFTAVNLVALLALSLGYGFSEDTPEYMNAFATYWANFTELLLFPLNDLWVNLPKDNFWNSDFVSLVTYALNSLLWGAAIASSIKAYRNTKTEKVNW
ncbi:hypothetical protein [Pseudoalteromonas sp. H105]|uniref:hypothetical protein n=1 Tax=Pseudoalteromonas sp. H105 TaxID=1348393 RepID=UPI000731FAD2|nr:hypothetical protein [Pseudoalteromonas sp. H105]KTF16566.1 hypothetical protein ATS75_03690 [Pseudoalteromonas sp. H105]